MPDREKVIAWLADEELYYRDHGDTHNSLMACNALELLKEQEEREKAICKEICDFIRGACSTDTDDDKDFVCYEIQRCFTHFGRSVKWE